MSPLFTFGRTPSPAQTDAATPHLTHLHPSAALPGGEIELHGTHLGASQPGQARHLPHVTLNDITTPVTLSRPTRTIIRIPAQTEGAFSGDLILHRPGSSSSPTGSTSSNALPLRVARLMAEDLHPVANPAVDASGSVFVTLSGARGQTVPVSIFRIDTRADNFAMRPFVRDLLNPTGLAFDRAGNLFASSRADGAIYRITPSGAVSQYAEGMGIATGIAFDRDGNLFVGDRSGTIFKIAPSVTPEAREIFVFATLEPSVAAYHLAFNDAGTLFVSGPTTASSQTIHAIDRDGNTTVFFHGLGRPQGMAFDVDDNLYVAASLHGQRGIVRINPAGSASLAVAGNNLIGLAFLPHGACVLATRDAVHHLDLGIHGRPLL